MKLRHKSDDDHRKCRICGLRVPDDITLDKDVELWKLQHLYYVHYYELGWLDRYMLKHTVGLGVEPPRENGGEKQC